MPTTADDLHRGTKLKPLLLSPLSFSGSPQGRVDSNLRYQVPGTLHHALLVAPVDIVLVNLPEATAFLIE